MIINNDKEYALEDFLNEETEYSKMTPSPEVWKRISKKVKPSFRWGIWVMTFHILFVPYSLVMYYQPFKKNSADTNNKASNNTSINNTDNRAIAFNSNIRRELNNHNNIALVSDNLTIKEDIIVPAIRNHQQADNTTIDNLKTSFGEILTEHLAKPMLNLSSNASIAAKDLPVKHSKQKTNIKRIVSSNLKTKSIAKLSLEVYATPSVSYRNLSDDKERLQYYRNTYRNNPFTENIAAKNINTVVNERTSLGKEIGVGLVYNLGSNWKLKTGLQFNERQYSIEAYKAAGVANYAYIKNNRLDSVSQNALYATMGTNKVTLNNSIYQLSMPVGVEFIGYKKNKFNIGIGASIEPTYLLQDNTYVLSTDYQYYSKGEKFSRSWNINSAIDVSFNFTAKKYLWYLAPQYRYQLLSTYNNLYAIKEHRWDLGLKIGVLKTF